MHLRHASEKLSKQHAGLTVMACLLASSDFQSQFDQLNIIFFAFYFTHFCRWMQIIEQNASHPG